MVAYRCKLVGIVPDLLMSAVLYKMKGSSFGCQLFELHQDNTVYSVLDLLLMRFPDKLVDIDFGLQVTVAMGNMVDTAPGL